MPSLPKSFTNSVVGILIFSVVAGVLFVPVSAVLAGGAGAAPPPARPGFVPDSSKAPTAPQNTGPKTASDPPTTKGCIGSAAWGYIPTINFDGCVALMANLAMWFSARTLWLSGILMNISLGKTLDMAGLLNDLPIVDIGWKVIRDIANIVFIFIALWCGITITIGLRAEQAWGFLAQMVLVALFINFSLFITKAVVDASNIAALHFYNLITPPQNRLDWDGGLSDAFMQGLRLQTIYDPNSLSGGGNGPVAGMDLGGQSINMMNIILMGIFGSVFMLVAAFVFFAASIMFILRAVYLIMLMVLSPLAFVAWLLPGASGIASNWWSKLWSQAFFAPLYLALSYIVVYTINSPAFQQTMGALTNGGTGKSFAAAFTGNTAGPIIIVFNYIILTFFMVGCLIVAQSLGARGSELMMHWGQKLKGEGISLVGRQAMGGFHFREHGLIDRKGKDWAKHLEDKGLFGINKLKIAKDGKFSKYMRSMGGREVLSVRKLNETWEKSKLGQGTVGKFMREQTTGRLSESTFGGSKSAEQSYEEFEHMESRREDIRWGQQARDGVTQLAPLRKDLRAHYDKRLDAEKMVSTAEETYANTEKARDAGLMSDSDVEKARVQVMAAKDNHKAVEADITKFKDTNGANVARYTRQISEALARMSTEGFLNQQKDFFKKNGVMDIEILGAEKYSALMSSEHFTEPEKEEYTRARLERVNEDAKRGNDRIGIYNDALKRHEKGATKIEVEVKIPGIKTDLEKATTAFNAAQLEVNNLKKEKRDAEAEAKMPALAELRGKKQVEEEKLRVAEKKKQTRIKEEVDAGRMTAKPKHALRWDNDELRKALRNIRSSDEVINYYKHGRETLNQPNFVATVMQGIWNDVRKSGKVDSSFVEQYRVDKRYYVQDACDYSIGFDPSALEKLDKMDTLAVKGLRKEASDLLKNVGPEGYAKAFHEGEEGQEGPTLAERYKELADRYNSTLAEIIDDVTGEKKKVGAVETTPPREEYDLRLRTGEKMYDEVSQYLANNEFQMMPGILRNQYLVYRNLDRATLAPWQDKDVDEKMPVVEFLLSEYRKHITSKGTHKMSKSNLNLLQWFVNENGKDFIPWQTITDPELRDAFEMVKARTARSQDARSASSNVYGRYGNPEERHILEARMRELAEIGDDEPLVDPFDEIGLKAP